MTTTKSRKGMSGSLETIDLNTYRGLSTTRGAETLGDF